MKKMTYQRTATWFIRAGVLVACLVWSPAVSAWMPFELSWAQRMNPLIQKTLAELEHTGLLNHIPDKGLLRLAEHQLDTGKPLGEILQDESWCRRLGLVSESYKATWYMANPFDLLPEGLQEAIRRKKAPFRSRAQVWRWCRANKVPRRWRKALYAALVETTPHNLWRASRGQRPYTKNGRFLEPIVIDRGRDRLEVRNGHIATDPAVIPTNTKVWVLVQVMGVNKIVLAEAADVGGGIKGKHVDLPIHVGPEADTLPKTRLPKEHIRNRTVRILSPLPAPNPGRKA